MSLIDIELELAKEYEKYYKNAEKYVKRIAKAAKEIFGNKLIAVYWFGSTLKGNWVPLKSDIDVLIVVDLPKEITRKSFWKAKKELEILEKANLPDIFQIHILSKEDYKLFERMIDKKKGIWV